LLQIKNVSTKNILAYSYDVQFTDPATAKGLGRGGGATIMINTNTDRANPMLPGAAMPSPKASVPSRNPDGIVPAASFSVDLVIFDDDTTWGQEPLRGARRCSRTCSSASPITSRRNSVAPSRRYKCQSYPAPLDPERRAAMPVLHNDGRKKTG
jgi:hypothetical protein